jgi:hypothetical protein
MREKYMIGLANLVNGSLLGYEDKSSINNYKKSVKDYVKYLEEENAKLNHYKRLYASVKDKNNAMSFVLRPVEENFIYDFLPVCVENNLPGEVIGNIFDREEENEK